MAGQLHFAFGDDIEAVARLTLVENGGAARESHRLKIMDEVPDGNWVNALENAGTGEDLGDVAQRSLHFSQ